MSRLRITPEIERHITAAIRGGAFAHVAAESIGVPRRIFSRWLARGRRKRALRLYRQFWLNVVQAKGQARLAAEFEARKKDVKFWLRYGPGKEASDAPAWVPPSKLPARKGDRGRGFEEFQQMFGILLQVLAPYPDARNAILQAFGPEMEQAPHPDTPSNRSAGKP
jgi:hypothetical protein